MAELLDYSMVRGVDSGDDHMINSDEELWFSGEDREG
jgi:hypothetical protein